MYLFGSALFALAFFFGGDWMSKFFYSGKAEYNKYFGYILPLTILQAGCALIDVYLNNFTKVIIPALFKEFLLKLTLPLLIGLHVLGYISIQTVMIGLLGNYLLALILLLIYTFYLGQTYHQLCIFCYPWCIWFSAGELFGHYYDQGHSSAFGIYLSLRYTLQPRQLH